MATAGFLSLVPCSRLIQTRDFIYYLIKQEMKVKINGADVEIQFTPTYTRGIDKEFQKILFKGVKANTNTATQGIDMNLENVQDANDYLVKAMTNLNEEQISQLSIEDYNQILAEIEKIKIPSK